MRTFSRPAVLAASALACIFATSACTASSGSSPMPTASPVVPVGQYIKHVVFIVQENRTFVNMFAGWPGADAPMTGYALDSKGKRYAIPLKVVKFTDESPTNDICHTWQASMQAWNKGKMDGFNRQQLLLGCNGGPAGKTPYSYLDHSEIQPYRDMASQYTLSDRFFPTEFGTSFTAHQDLIAGTTQIDSNHSLVNTPSDANIWGCDAAALTVTSLVDTNRKLSINQGPFPCFTQYGTAADILDGAHVSWHFYSNAPTSGIIHGGIWDSFGAIKNVWSNPQRWKNNVNPTTTVLKDIKNGNLPAVTWVIPDLFWSDYSAAGSDQGPSWVGDIVNSIGQSQYWKDTAIVVVWDDYGGFYDDASPPQLDYVGLGIRVPCLIISPYARPGYVSHTQYEYGSLLKFMEQAFNLPSLNTTDVRANSIVDSFDFTQTPITFKPIKTKYSVNHFLQQATSSSPPDSM